MLKIAYTEKRDRTPFERDFLTKYVKHDQSKEKIDECFSPRVRVTNVIIGGIAVDGNLNRARKRFLGSIGIRSVGICSIQKDKIQLEHRFW